ncbi:GNAT family N-acetyltransferase [Rhizobium sp. TRM95111]|uniref:GNAT family N-acetyltransferase n=1 Tax=Rhizobium alarense TaxID=2846851 RepID=UPI001F20CC17|nr:GNAT family N-acetyltransferase [Rhizobium alarense]MCF3639459.1 GNAT family N-acetyltransferase [Rhizobium alarense]
MEYTIRFEKPTTEDVLLLLAEGEAYGASLYPAESNHFLPLDAVCAANIHFAVARTMDGTAVGTGAIAVFDGWAEIKRMWVVPSARGAGISKAMLSTLQATAQTMGASVLRLETGVLNVEALALYERFGFARRAPFAEYRPDPLSVFMEKDLP